MSQIQAGGAAVVITARDQATPALQRLAGAADAAKSRVQGVGGGTGIQNLKRVADQVATRFVGIGVSLAALDMGLRTAGKALVESLSDPSKDFWTSFSEGFADTARQIPILGGALQVLFSEQFAAIDRIKAETAEIAGRAADARQRREAIQRGETAIRRAQEDRAIDADELAARSSGTLGNVERAVLDRQRARLEAQRFLEDEARRLGVNESTTGFGGEVFRQLEEESRARLEARMKEIDAEFAEREKRSDEEARKAAEAKLAAEREVAARIEELQLDQQDRLALARLDAEEASIGPEDTVQNRVRQAEIAAQRELLSVQQQLDQAEARILDEKGLTAEQRNAAIEAERQIAELQAETIREGVDRARRGEDRASELAGFTRGTFSAFSAGRLGGQQSLGQRTLEEARKQSGLLQQIESNTRTGAEFAA